MNIGVQQIMRWRGAAKMLGLTRERFSRRCSAFVALAGLLLSGVANAGTQTGKVTDIQVRASDGLVLFYLTGDHANRPACAAHNTYWMIKNENTDTGKRQLALLLTARSTGATVAVYGANTCLRWPDGEDADAITLTSQ